MSDGAGAAVAYETIVLERAGDDEQIAVVTLNRPHVHNAENTQMGLELRSASGALRADRDVRCVVLTGAGTRAFCTGADLKERNGMTDEQFKRQHELFEEAVFEGLMAIGVPVLAAVEGYCLAGGFELALACDLIVASREATFGLTEVTRGIMPGIGGTVQLPRLAGRPFAKDVILTGRTFGAEEAYQRGIVARLAPAGRAKEEALTIARTIAKNAPIAIRQAKKSIDHAVDVDLRTGLAFSIEAYNFVIGTEDRIEGIAAFNEKREPKFKNR